VFFFKKKALLADGRVDPSKNNSVMLRAAAYDGRSAIVDALLADGRSNPDAVVYATCGVLPALRAETRWRRRLWLQAGVRADA
jgi:hypothetical protein